MALVRCVTEMGMGVDVHGLDYTTAAKRAVFDALHHSSLGFPRLVGKTAEICARITIGVPKPEAVDRQAVLERYPTVPAISMWSMVDCRCYYEGSNDGPLIASAIVIVSLDDGK